MTDERLDLIAHLHVVHSQPLSQLRTEQDCVNAHKLVHRIAEGTKVPTPEEMN